MSNPSTMRPLTLTDIVRKAFEQQQTPRRAFALQFLDARFEQRSIAWQSYEMLTRMVRLFNNISRLVFMKEWNDVGRTYAEVLRLASLVHDFCEQFCQHSMTQITWASNMFLALPSLNVSSTAALLERLLIWQGSLQALDEPNDEDPVTFLHIAAHYHDTIWTPLLKLHRQAPSHPMGQLIEVFDALRDGMFRMQQLTRDAYRSVYRLVKQFRFGCELLDEMQKEKEDIPESERERRQLTGYRRPRAHTCSDADFNFRRNRFTEISTEVARHCKVQSAPSTTMRSFSSTISRPHPLNVLDKL